MMNQKMKRLALAVGVALGGLSALPSAEAVSVSADNLGQVLLFPYYTVRGGWNTLFGVTNTSDRVVAVKVRFREALNSRDVFDFNVILSPFDVWTGYLAEGGSGPVLKTTDNSCTVGAIPAAGQAFTTVAYTGPGAADGGGTSVDRLRDGYVEMIMMGAAAATPNALAAGAIHGSDGKPTGCAALISAFTNRADSNKDGIPDGLAAVQAAFPEMIPSPLKGTFSLVNATPGKGFNAVGLPTALNNFRAAPYVTLQLPPLPASGTNAEVTPANSGYEPTLAAATTAGVYYGANDVAVTGAPTGAAAVTDALVQQSVLNEWSKRADPSAAWATLTDWVVTFPTKMFYVDLNTTQYGARTTGRVGLPASIAPFTEAFDGKSCDDIGTTESGIIVRDREEQRAPEPTYSDFSPWDVQVDIPQLCYEANVLTFNKGALLASDRSLSIQYPESYLYG